MPNSPKMTRGTWRFEIDQGRDARIIITNLPITKKVAIKQNEQKIIVKQESLDEMIDALRSAKRWLMSN